VHWHAATLQLSAHGAVQQNDRSVRQAPREFFRRFAHRRNSGMKCQIEDMMAGDCRVRQE